MKDIAIYRLQRVDKALERLTAAVTRLDAAIQSKGIAPSQGQDQGADEAAPVQAELDALRKDYEALHAAASTVAERLDGTVARLKADAATTTGEGAASP